MTYACSRVKPRSWSRAIMFSRALRQAVLRFSPWLTPFSSTGMPMVAMNRRGTAQRGSDEVVAALEPRPADAPALSLAPVHAEAHRAGGAHLHGGDADLAVALGEVAVAGREQRALHRDREQQLRALTELLHVEVAPVLSGRQRAESVGGGVAGG